MKRITWMIGLLLSLFAEAVTVVPSSSAADAPAIVVGRIYHIEGDLLRYVPEENDWVAVVEDAPFGTQDTLFSGSRGMGELIAPNGTWIRIGNSTQIQFIALNTDLSETDVATGVARFYNKGSDTLIKATSPFGYVLADPGTVFDFYVGENSVEVTALSGKVSFVHAATDARYDVSAGSPSILADQSQVSSGEGIADPDWDRWNSDRESFWATKAGAMGRSAEYLPPNLQNEAYAFEENGTWEDVPYEGEPRRFWRPTTVAVGWSPFTVGRWTDWYGDPCWIPAEPFGYVTHHYGNWVYVRNSWYWAPPVLNARVGLPLLNIGFFWYPGRVSWIHRDTNVGWVPLAPRETYYSHRNWGDPHTVVVTNVNIAQIHINARDYAYANHAIVVNRNNFYRVKNYRDVRVTDINRTTLINNYRAAPVINNTVINHYTTNKQRYNYTNTPANEKPHNTVMNRIQHNEAIIHGGRKENAAGVKERAKRFKEGEVNREARIETPKSTNYIVPAKEVNRPKSEIKLQQSEIKNSGSGAPQVHPAQPAEPQRVIPATPAQPENARPERVEPPKPSRRGKPAQPVEPQRVIPTTPAQPENARPERVEPSKPSRREKPAQPAEPQRVIPTTPAHPENARPERVAPSKPIRREREKPAQIAEPQRVIPAKPAQPGQPERSRPESVAPKKADTKEKKRDQLEQANP